MFSGLSKLMGTRRADYDPDWDIAEGIKFYLGRKASTVDMVNALTNALNRAAPSEGEVWDASTLPHPKRHLVSAWLAFCLIIDGEQPTPSDKIFDTCGLYLSSLALFQPKVGDTPIKVAGGPFQHAVAADREEFGKLLMVTYDVAKATRIARGTAT